MLFAANKVKRCRKIVALGKITVATSKRAEMSLDRMSSRFTISQLAKAAGIPTSTIRYYERIGLVHPEDRSEGNYRLYGDESLHKLKFIKSAQSIGFTLENVNALLSDEAGEKPTCGNVKGLIEERLGDVEKRLKDLKHVQRVLKTALKKCQSQKETDCCQVIEEIY